MIRNARVLGNAPANSQAIVQLNDVSACRQCTKGRGCGAGVFNRQGSAIKIHCYTSTSVLADQSVQIEIDDSEAKWLPLVAISYGLPLAGMLFGSLLATGVISGMSLGLVNKLGLQNGDALVAMSAALGLVLGIFLSRYKLRTINSDADVGLCMHSARIVDERSLSVTS